MAIFSVGRAIVNSGTGLGGTPGAGSKLIFTSSAVTGAGSISVTDVSRVNNVVVSARGGTTTIATNAGCATVHVNAVTQGLPTTAPVVSVCVVRNDSTTNSVETTAFTVELVALGEKRRY